MAESLGNKANIFTYRICSGTRRMSRANTREFHRPGTLPRLRPEAGNGKMKFLSAAAGSGYSV